MQIRYANHSSSTSYCAGDIIGCSIDADLGQVDFWLNGVHLGAAAKGLAKGDGTKKVFYPVIDVNVKKGAAAINLTGPF